MASRQAPRGPRPADLAIAGNRMLIRLLNSIWAMNYQHVNPSSMAASLAVMVVSMCAAVASNDDAPLTITQLAGNLGMPPSNVRRYVELLLKHKRVKMIHGRKRGRGQEKVIMTDLDHLDRLMTLDHLDRSIVTIRTCLDELTRLRPLLHDQLAANGKDKAE